MQHDSATGACVCVWACVCVLSNLKSVTVLQLLVCLCPSAIPRSSLQTFGWTHLAKLEWVKILLGVCVCVYASVCVCWGWGCCHFGNATAHIAAITTAEKCFSATCNYYRLQIAVLASEALARKRETLCVCVCMWTRVCACRYTQIDSQTQRQRKMRNDYSSH